MVFFFSLFGRCSEPVKSGSCARCCDAIETGFYELIYRYIEIVSVSILSISFEDSFYIIGR